MKDETRKLIAGLLADGDPDVRRQAAETLQDDGSLAVVVALAAALQDESKGVRDAAFRSLLAIDNANVALAIVEYIGNENITTRNLASELLMKLGKKSIHPLLPFLKDPSQDVRKFAVDILGLIGTDEQAEALIPLLDDPDENVVVSTVEAIGNLRGARALQALFSAYDHHDYAQSAIAEALGKIGDPAASDFLLLRAQEAMGQSMSDPLLLFALIEALGGLGTDRAFTVLMQSTDRVKGRLRSALLHTLVQISRRSSGSLEFPAKLRVDFLSALKDPDVAVRLSAAEVLVRVPGEQVTSALIACLGTSADMDALLLANLPSRGDALTRAVHYLDEHRNDPAAPIIALIGRLAVDLTRHLMQAEYSEDVEQLSGRAFILIADRWMSADEETRATIVDALFRLDGDNAVEFLDAIMNDPDPWLRMHVIEIIAAIADPRAPEFISRFLQDEDEMVREVAMATLQSRGFAVDAAGSEA